MLKILLVDDIHLLRTMASAYLAVLSPQAHILHASSGNEAIQIIEAERPDIVICDYDMPDGNGGDVFKYMRKKYPKMRFILSSSWLPSELAEFKGCENALSLPKPYNKEEMKNVLNKALEEPDENE